MGSRTYGQRSLQDTLGCSGFETGLRFLPLTPLVLVAAPISGRLSALEPVATARVAVGASRGTP
jgi:hypothetical protein